MSKNYTAFNLYVASEDDLQIVIHSDTLDGAKGLIELKDGEGENAKSLGWFNIEQLQQALRLAEKYAEESEWTK